jgi:hypothetical protein
VAVVEGDHLVGAGEGGRAVGHHQERRPRVAQQAVPQGSLGVEVQRAGDVVEDQEVGAAGHRAGGRDALRLDLTGDPREALRVLIESSWRLMADAGAGRLDPADAPRLIAATVLAVYAAPDLL